MRRGERIFSQRTPSRLCTRYAPRFVQHGEQFRMAQPVKDTQAFLTTCDQACIAQRHQLLRDISLALSKHRLNVADTGFPAAQELQNPKSGWMRHSTQRPGIYI